MKIKILKQNGYNFLWINDYLWMWDIPVERAAQRKLANEAYGSVLVAGYGLGIIQKYLLQNKKVTSVTTIEIHPKVIKECKKEYGKIFGDVIYLDFYKYNTTSRFDCIVGDVWEDILPEELEKYKKFESKAKQLLNPNGKILAWGKDFYEYLIDKNKEKE